MRPGRSHFEGPLDVLLPFHIGKVLTVRCLLSKQRLHITDRRCEMLCAIKEPDSLGERGHGIDRHTLYDGGFGRILRWHQHSRHFCLTRCQRHRHGASHGFDATVEREFANDNKFVQLIRLDIASSMQDPQGDGEVKGRAFLTQVRRGEIDRDTFERKGEATIGHGRFDAITTLTNRRIRKPYGGKDWQAIGEINLNFHNPGVNT